MMVDTCVVLAGTNSNIVYRWAMGYMNYKTVVFTKTGSVWFERLIGFQSNKI
jgi:hypothetical protein